MADDDLDLGATETNGHSAPEPTQQSVLADYFRGKGVEVEPGLSDDDIFQTIGGWQSAAERAQRFADIPDDADPKELLQYADIGRQYAPYQSQFEQFRKTLEQPPPQAQQQQAGPDENALKLARQVCKTNPETGLYEPIHPMYAESARVLNDVAQKSRMHMEQFGMDPDGFLKPRIEPLSNEIKALKEQIAQYEAMRTEWQQERDERQVNAFVYPFRNEIWTFDEAGNATEMTMKGQVLQQALEAQDPNIPIGQRLQNAKNAADAWEFQQSRQPNAKPFTLTKPQQAQQQAAPAPTAPERKKSFVDAGRQRAQNGRFVAEDRSATVRNAARRNEPQGREKSFEELYLEAKNAQ